MRMLAKGFAGQVHMGRDVVFDTHTKQREKQSWTGHCTVLPPKPIPCTGSQPQHPREHLQWEQQEEWKDESKTGVVLRNTVVRKAEEWNMSSACPPDETCMTEQPHGNAPYIMDGNLWFQFFTSRKLEVHVTPFQNTTALSDGGTAVKYTPLSRSWDSSFFSSPNIVIENIDAGKDLQDHQVQPLTLWTTI